MGEACWSNIVDSFIFQSCTNMAGDVSHFAGEAISRKTVCIVLGMMCSTGFVGSVEDYRIVLNAI